METTKKQARRSYSAAEKKELLESYKTSGLSCKQWCKENGIGLSTLHRWLQKERKTENLNPVQTWVPVVTITEEKSDMLKLQVGQITIPVTINTDMRLLATVLKVMKDLC